MNGIAPVSSMNDRHKALADLDLDFRFKTHLHILFLKCTCVLYLLPDRSGFRCLPPHRGKIERVGSPRFRFTRNIKVTPLSDVGNFFKIVYSYLFILNLSFHYINLIFFVRGWSIN